MRSDFRLEVEIPPGQAAKSFEILGLRAFHHVVRESGRRRLLPADPRASKWNRELVQKGMTPAGREFLGEALAAMGCSDRAGEIVSVPDLIDFDEGRIE